MAWRCDNRLNAVIMLFIVPRVLDYWTAGATCVLRVYVYVYVVRGTWYVYKRDRGPLNP